MQAMHELDIEDVEWINVTANYWRGKASVFKGHDNLHRTIFASMSVEDTSIRSIAPDLAVAGVTMHFGPLPDLSGREQADLKTRGSFTMVKRDGVWKIAHFQNTVVDLEAEKNDPTSWDERGFVPGGYK